MANLASVLGVVFNNNISLRNCSLNDVTSTGFYAVTATNASTVTEKPAGGACRIIVIYITSSVLQIWWKVGQTEKDIAIRMSQVGSADWNNWKFLDFVSE